MGENSTGIPFFDWMLRYLAVVLPIFAGLIGGAIHAFRSYRKSINDDLIAAKKLASEELSNVQDAARDNLDHVKNELRAEIKEAEHQKDVELAKVWAEMNRMLSVQGIHIGEIAVLKVEQRNAWHNIEEIKSLTRDTSRKVDELSVNIAAIPGNLLEALRKLQ